MNNIRFKVDFSFKNCIKAGMGIYIGWTIGRTIDACLAGALKKALKNIEAENDGKETNVDK